MRLSKRSTGLFPSSISLLKGNCCPTDELFSQKVRRAEITDVPTSSSRTTLLRSPDVY